MDLFLRRLGRLSGLGWILLVAAPLDYARTVAGRHRRDRLALRAAWLQRQARRVARLVRLRLRVEGQWAGAPVVTANHLGYLDAITLPCLAPLAFVAKSDVRRWPVLGWLTALGGTVYCRRAQPRDLEPTARRLAIRAAHGVSVVVFPEGTSSDGTWVLPFRSPLLEPAAREGWAVQPVWLGYEAPGCDAARDLCWWGAMRLAPHLWRLLGAPEIRATVRLGPPLRGPDRKQLARHLQAAVIALASPAPFVPRISAAAPALESPVAPVPA